MHLILIQFFLVLSLLISSTVEDEDWPDWRGLQRDGTCTEEGIMKEFPSGSLPVKWSTSVNSGYSGPSIEGGRVYLTDRLTRPEPLERVLCFDAENGDAIWQFSYECEYEGIGYPAGPRASVIIDGPYAYSLGAMGDLYCFNKVTGVVIWHRALKKAAPTPSS